MSRNHYVYLITNLINNKKYIGKRSCCCSIEADAYMGSGTLVKKAQEKYGLENFQKEILEVCSSEKEAFEKEMYYIKIFNAKKSPDYYNLTDGGEGVSGYWQGLTREERREKTGWNLTEEEYQERCRKLSESQRKIANKRTKGVLMVDLYTHEIIKEFPSVKEASPYVGVHPTNLYKARREGRTCGGFFWCYEEEYEERFGRR